MSLYVYRSQASTGARDLAEVLNGIRYRGTNRPIGQRAQRGDVVVCWGEACPNIAGVRVLNGAPLVSKFTDAERLRAAGIPTVEVSRTPPQARPAAAPPDPARPLWDEARELASTLADLDTFRRDAPLIDGVRQLQATITRLSAALQVPAPVAPPAQVLGVWLPRSNSHVGGDDLLDPPEQPDYYSKKEDFVKEFRVHSFLNKSIRAGVKAPREGFTEPAQPRSGLRTAHAWIRSWDGGWRILYDGISSKKKHRLLAHRAVQALGLQFGAVDIGQKADGSLVVLEVNRAPGLDGGTIDRYAEAIRRWVDGTWPGQDPA